MNTRQVTMEYLNLALEGINKTITAQLDAQKQATLKSEAAIEKRFESVNEFREQLADQAARFLPRTEFDAAMKSLLEKIEDLKSSRDILMGKSVGLSAGWGYLIGIIGIALAAVSLALRLK